MIYSINGSFIYHQLLNQLMHRLMESVSDTGNSLTSLMHSALVSPLVRYSMLTDFMVQYHRTEVHDC
jgi:hypothetical protein